MKKIIAQVYEETDYSQFKRLPDNRDVISSRINKLIASMLEKYILNPIICNEKMEVVDGQGRFEARKAINKPIHYIIVPGATSDDCRRMNKYNTKWQTLDFVKSYAKCGLIAYKRLLKTKEITGFPISTVLRLANHGVKTNQTDKMSLLEKGKLIFSEEDAEKVKQIESHINELIDALQFGGRINDAFKVGVKVIMETEGYDPSRMIRNCKSERSTFVQMAKLSDQLVEFERIYNKRLSGANKIYFSDYMRNKGDNIRDYSQMKTQFDYTDISSLKEEY